MDEKTIEARLVLEVRKRGGLTYKFVSPGNTGVPDRIIITSKGTVWFVELKTERGRLSQLQRHQLALLKGSGANALVVYGMEDMLHTLEVIFHEV